MKYIAQRYLATSFILPFLVSCSFFISFLLTFQLFKITGLMIKKGVDLTIVIEIIFHLVVSLIPIAVPIAVFFSCYYSLNKLSMDSEFIAMRSFGFSLRKLLYPFLIVALAIGSLLFVMNLNFVPESRYQMRAIIGALTTKGVLTDIKPGIFFSDIPNITIYAKDVSNQGKNLSQVFINTKEKDGDKEKVIFARQGFLLDDDKEGDKVFFKLKLIDGNMAKTSHSNKDLEKIVFSEYIFPLNEANFDKRPVKIENLQTIFKTITDKELREQSGKEEWFIRSELEFWDRLNTPLVCVIFTFLGFTLGIQKSRGKGRNSGVVSFVVLLFYYAIFFAGVSLAKKGHIPSAFATLFPSLLTFIIAFRFYRKLNWIA